MEEEEKDGESNAMLGGGVWTVGWRGVGRGVCGVWGGGVWSVGWRGMVRGGGRRNGGQGAKIAVIKKHEKDMWLEEVDEIVKAQLAVGFVVNVHKFVCLLL